MNLFGFFQQPTAQRPQVDQVAPSSPRGGAREVVVVRKQKIESDPTKQDGGSLTDVAFLKKPPAQGKG